MNRVSNSIKTKLENLPEKPGVYLFKDSAGEVIYVGKAVSLRDRVRSYFRSARGLTGKVLTMMGQVEDLEYILTDSEVEALVLESNLIKEYRPRYNVRLRDDKNYPFLRVTLNEEWPRLVVARSFKDDGSRYFGPYTRGGSLQETIRTLRQVFPFRTCSDARFRQHRERPCLHYYIKRCQGPCAGFSTQEDYRAVMNQLVMFLDGRGGELLERIRREMKDAAERLDFEQAARLRDRLRLLEAVVEKQKVVSARLGDEDFVAIARPSAGPAAGTVDEPDGDQVEDACAHVFFVRGGKLVGREAFLLAKAGSAPDGEILGAFLKQFYALARDVPPVINVQAQADDAEAIAEWLTGLRRGRVQIRIPRKGDRRQLLEMAEKNARSFLMEEILCRRQVAEKDQVALVEIRDALGLPSLPGRIECYDISNTQGRQAVGSMVVFEGGRPAKGEYRVFRIQGVQGPDDFAMIREVISRRFQRYLRETEKGSGAVGGFGRRPDLVIIDGGGGQLSAASETMDSLGLKGIPVFGLAKENEWLFSRSSPEPIKLPRNSAGLHLLQRLRDEAHRFALTHHRKSRSRSMLRSILDDIPGVGPKRRKAILSRFKDLEGIRQAGVEGLAAIPGMNRTVAEEVLHKLNDTLIH